MKNWPLYGWLAVAVASFCLLLLALDSRRIIEWNTGRIDKNTERIENLIQQRTQDLFTASDARAWRAKLRKANEGIITVPEPDPKP